jgi:hypothetical protein
MRSRVLLAAGTTVAVLAMSVGTAAAAQWKKNETGMVEVCFTAGSGFDATAIAEAKAAAADWNAVSTNLNVTYGDCVPGANEVPMDVGLRLGAGQFGETRWLETAQGEFVSAEIQYDEAGAAEWATTLVSQLGEDAHANVWRQMMCHEMGHALGLPHVTATDSCMQTLVTLPNLKPGAGDKATLIGYYGGTAKTGTGATSSSSTSSSSTTSSTTTVPPVTIPGDDEDGTDDDGTGTDEDGTGTDEDGTGEDGEGTDSPVNTIPTIPVTPIGSTSVPTSPTTVPTDEDEDGDDGEEVGDEDNATTSTIPSSSTTSKSSTSSTSKNKSNKDKSNKDKSKNANKNNRKHNHDHKSGEAKKRCGGGDLTREQVRKMIKTMRAEYKEHAKERQALKAQHIRYNR